MTMTNQYYILHSIQVYDTHKTTLKMRWLHLARKFLCLSLANVNGSLFSMNAWVKFPVIDI